MLKDKPVRECSKFYGENRRSATVYQDLVTREYIVERETEGFTTIVNSGYTNRYEKLEDAENSAEDWVMAQ